MIEHVPDPGRFLRACRSCLRSGGHLALKTPNVASVIARINKSSWEWANPVTHLFLFSPRTLAEVVKKSGFHPIQIFTCRGDAHNPWLEIMRGATIRAGLHGRVKSTLKVGSVVSHTPDGKVRSFRMLRLLNRGLDVGLFWSWPIERFLDWTNLGPELRMVAVAI